MEPMSEAEVESPSFPEWSEAGASLRSALSPSATGALHLPMWLQQRWRPPTWRQRGLARDVRFLHQDIRAPLFFWGTLLGLIVIRVTQILKVTLGVGSVVMMRRRS